MSQAAVDMDTDVLVKFLIFTTVITGVELITRSAAAYFIERYEGSTGYLFRDNFARHFLSLPFGKFERKNSGEMLSVYSNDIPQAVAFVTSESLSLILNIVTVIATFIFMLTINPMYTLIYFASLPLLAFMQIKISTPLQKRSREMSIETAKFNAVVNDSLQNTSTIAAYSLEGIMEKRYLAAYDNYFAALKKSIATRARLVLTGMALSGAPFLFIILAAGLNVINGNMTLAAFVAYSSLAFRPISRLQMLSQQLGSIRVNMAGAVRFNENTEDTVQDIHTGEAVKDAGMDIKFDNVSFSYGGEGGALALDNVSFEIKQGERVAFVGGSGSGKSTVLKLLLGLYEPHAGSITVSGQNLDGLSKRALREHFAYVPQDNFMFPESIGENIMCVKPGNSDKGRLEKACENAGILDFINGLPDKFDTVLSESAENVSGGQRQRLAIARAFYKDAPAVLFDEATSALDPVTESAVLSTMETLMEGRTVLMVAHRAKAIAACDTIILMDAGKVAGIGSHEQLTKDNAIYASLYATLTEKHSEEEADLCVV